MTREEVVQAALTVERWCLEHHKSDQRCDCPFSIRGCELFCTNEPGRWNLEELLRKRGM